MAGALGSLVVEVAANVARFQSDMGKIAQIAESRAKQIDGVLNIVGNSLKALGAGLVIGLTIDKVRKEIDGAIASAAGLQQLSERTGATVEKLSGLVGIAKLSGTETESLATGLQRLSKSMVDAQNGGQATGAAFKAIGINAKDLKGLGAEDTFLLIAKRQAEYADGVGKTAVAQALLGKSGANLLPVMKDLAEAGDLQVRTTAAQAAAADEYEKNQTRLAAAQKGLFKIIAMELVPILNVFTLAMLDSATANDGMKRTAAELAREGSIERFARGSAQVLGLLIDAAEYASRAFQAAGKTIGYVAADAQLQVESLNNGLNLFKGNVGLKEFLAETNRISSARVALKDGLGGDLADLFGKATFTDRLKTRLAELDAAKAAVASPLPSRKAVNFDPTAESANKKTAGLGFVEQLQRQIQQQEKGRFEMLRLEAAQKGVSAAAAPYIAQLEQIELRQERIKRIVQQVASDEEQRAKVNTFVQAGNDTTKGLILQAQALGLTANEQRRLTELRRVDEAVQQAMVGATIETRAELELLAETMRRNVAGALDELERKEMDFATGARQAWRSYAESAANSARNAETLINGSLQRSEDALVGFVKTGKLSFSELFSFMAEEYLRQQIRMMFAGSTGGIFSALGSMVFGSGVFGSTANYNALDGAAHLANGMPYVPYDGMPAILHEGERVMTRAENAAGGGGGGGITIISGDTNVGAGVSRGDMAAALRASEARTVERVRRMTRQGTLS